MKALPNILSVFRICLVPLFIAAYVIDKSDVKYYAIIIFIIASISDVLDGFIARRFNAHSRLGKVLDPLGDKLINFSALVCIAITIANPLFTGAVCVYFIKEALMGIGGLLIHRKTKADLPQANISGKTATVFLCLTCITLLIWRGIPDYLAIIIIFLAILLTVIAFAIYLRTYIQIMKGRPHAPESEKGMD